MTTIKALRIQFDLCGNDIPPRLSPKHGDVLRVRYEDVGADKCDVCEQKFPAPYLLTATFNGRQLLKEHVMLDEPLKQLASFVHSREDVMYVALQHDVR